MTIRVDVRSIQQAVNKAGAALFDKYRDQIDRRFDSNPGITKAYVPQYWRDEYNADLILEPFPVYHLGVFAKYVDFESEQDYAWFMMRWS